MQYKTGTVSVTNGSQIVTGSGTLWLANVVVGALFTVQGDNVTYTIASVDTDLQITLNANYGGVTGSGKTYAAHRDFTSGSIPLLSNNDIETGTIFSRAMSQVQDLINASGGNGIVDNSTSTQLTLSDTDAVFGGGVNIADTKFLYFGSDLRFRSISNQGVIENLNSTFYIIQSKASGLVQLKAANSVGTSKKCIELGGAVPIFKAFYDDIEVFATILNGTEWGTFSSSGATPGATIETGGQVRTSTVSVAPTMHHAFYNPNGFVGQIVTTGTATSYNTTSDKRKKKSFGEVTNPFNVLDKFEIHDAAFLTDLEDRKMMVMAQDVQPYYPQAISYDEGNDNWGADYGQFSPLALACIKDLHKRLQTLEAA